MPFFSPYVCRKIRKISLNLILYHPILCCEGFFLAPDVSLSLFLAFWIYSRTWQHVNCSLYTGNKQIWMRNGGQNNQQQNFLLRREVLPFKGQQKSRFLTNFQLTFTIDGLNVLSFRGDFKSIPGRLPRHSSPQDLIS